MANGRSDTHPLSHAERLAEAESAVDATRLARDVAAVEETRLALSLETAPASADREALARAHQQARIALMFRDAEHAHAVRDLFAIAAENATEQLELAGFVTRLAEDGRIRMRREWA